MTRRTAAWCTFALVVAAFVLRLIGLGYSLPATAEHDERMWESQLADRRGTPSPLADDYSRYYPDLVPIICAAITHAGKVPAGANPEEHRAAAGHELTQLRFLGMLISLLAIPATYRIARLVLQRPASLVAASFAATSALTQSLAQQARPHATAGALVAVALLCLVAARRRPRIGRWILAGVVSAAALGVLQSASALIPAFVLAVILSEPLQPGQRRSWIGPFMYLLILSTAYFVQPAVGTVAMDEPVGPNEVRLAGHVIHFDRINGGGFARLFWQVWVIDSLILVLVFVGIARAIVERPWRSWSRTTSRDFLVVLAHAVPYALVLGMYSESFDRFVIPLLPVASMCAGGALMGWSKTPARAWVAIAVVVCAAQGAYALRFSMYRAQPDTFERAAHWLEANVRPSEGPIVTVPYVEMPVLRTPASMRVDSQQKDASKYVWQRYLARVPAQVLEDNGYDLSAVALPRDEAGRMELRRDPSAFVARIHARYAIVQRVVGHKLLDPIRAEIAARGKLVARFTPLKDGGDLSLPPPHQSWIRSLMQLECEGPTIEIYRM